MSEKTSPARAGRRFSFRAKLQIWAEGMDYCAVAVPAVVTKGLGPKKAVLVLAQVNESTPFKVSLFPVGGGRHFIRIKAKVRKEIGVNAGDGVFIKFTILDRSHNTYPRDLLKVLRAEGLLKDFKALPPGAQNFLLRKIEEAVQPATRGKRIQEAVKSALSRRKKLSQR